MKLVTCPVCNESSALPDQDRIWVRCASCQGMLFSSTNGPMVLIAHRSEQISHQIGGVLLQAGLSPLHTNNGEQAIKLLEIHRPKGLVMDVALEGLLAFQVIHHLRNTSYLQDTKVVLVASIYSKTAYKRRPTSLYGADDYVEQHHIPDMLPAKLNKLLRLQVHPGTARRTEAILQTAQREDRIDRQRVATLAHSIVSDIALYYQTEIEAVARDGDLEVIGPLLQEGRNLLGKMISKEHLGDLDPIQEAFMKLLESLRQKA